jgi:hypothetical protein
MRSGFIRVSRVSGSGEYCVSTGRVILPAVRYMLLKQYIFLLLLLLFQNDVVVDTI